MKAKAPGSQDQGGRENPAPPLRIPHSPAASALDRVTDTSHQASNPFNVQSPNLFDIGPSPHFPTTAQGNGVLGATEGSGCSLQVFSWLLLVLGQGQGTPRTPC